MTREEEVSESITTKEVVKGKRFSQILLSLSTK